MSQQLQIVPMVLDEANAFVREHHRHHKPVPGAKFCVGVADGQKIVGVAIVDEGGAIGGQDGLDFLDSGNCRNEIYSTPTLAKSR